MTSSGVPISSNAPLANTKPIIAIKIPLTSATVIDVCTVSDISLSRPAAKNRAANTFAPSEIPIKKFVNTLINAVVEPTAASDSLPLKRPTTTISTALNINCKMPENMSGSAKEINLSIIVPLHISISYLFFCLLNLILSSTTIYL